MERHKEYRVCSLFAGAGGIDYAFQQAGCQTVWANENDHDACLTYHLNFPDIPLDRRDLRNVPAANIPDFDILVGGFPCQPFSAVGRERGFQDDRGNLFFEICRVIDAKTPAAIFLENVASLESHDHGNTFKVIKEQLAERGYWLKHLVADAQEYGFPQRRNRIYIVGFKEKKAFDQFVFPEKSRLLLRTWDIIDRSRKASDQYYLKPGTKQYEQMNQAICDDREIYRFSDGRYAARGGILSGRNGISFTLLAGMGNWHDREPVIRDNWGIRKLAARECFKLQGFPEQFSLKGIPEKSAYRQAGNTVCVPVVRQFAERIVTALEALQEQQQPLIRQILVGKVRNQAQLNISLQKNFYHFPVRFMPERMDEIQWVAIFVSDRQTNCGGGIRYIGKIRNYQVLPRRAIAELPKQSEDLYCRVDVEKWEPVLNPPKLSMNGAVIKQLGINSNVR